MPITINPLEITSITANHTLTGSRGVGNIDASTITGVPSIGIFPPASTHDIIQGQMLTTSLTLHASEHTQMSEMEIKTRLTELLVREIWDNNCIEFTKQQDYARNEVVVRARIFVTPKDDVQVIRKVLK